MRHSEFKEWKEKSVGDLQVYQEELQEELKEVGEMLGVMQKKRERGVEEKEKDVYHRRKVMKPGKTGYKYPPGSHWTQKPENRHLVLKQVLHAARKRSLKG